jgi:undecaprenyl-diphosphatase
LPWQDYFVALDESARALVQRIASPGLTTAMRGFTLFGFGVVLTPLVVLAVVLFYRARRPHHAWLFGLTVAGAEVVDQGLKLLFHRARPEPFFGTLKPDSYSFPSGHAMVCCCFFGLLAALVAAREPRRGVRIAIWTAATIFAAAIGLSRIYLGVHYATDVLGGWVAALLWMLVVAMVYKRRGRYARHL